MDDFKDKLIALQKQYKDAVYLESAIREAAFLPVQLDICGIPVKQFTPYMYVLLDFVASPFLSGGLPDESKVSEFLWVVSTEYKDNAPATKETFIQTKLAALEYDKCIKEIDEYLTNTFIDTPPAAQPTQNGNKRIPYYAWIVSYIDALAHEYGWSDEVIIHLPFTRIFQYLKAIEARHMASAGKEPLLFNNLSDKAIKAIRLLHKEHEAKIKETI